jgi:hypothetical protein
LSLAFKFPSNQEIGKVWHGGDLTGTDQYGQSCPRLLRSTEVTHISDYGESRFNVYVVPDQRKALVQVPVPKGSGTGLCSDDRVAGTLSLRQADRQLDSPSGMIPDRESHPEREICRSCQRAVLAGVYESNSGLARPPGLNYSPAGFAVLIALCTMDRR